MGISFLPLRFFLFLRLLTAPSRAIVCLLMPFFEHRRNISIPTPSPRTMMVSPPPPRTPEEDAERMNGQEEQEERDQDAETAKTESPWTIERHSIIGIRVRRGHSLTRWR